MNKKVAFILDRKSKALTIYVGSSVYTIDSDHCNYESVKDRLNTKVYDDLEELLDIPKAIANASDGKVYVKNDGVYYNGKQIHNVVVDMILEFMNDGFPFDAMALFLQNLLQNPCEETINECYEFLESGKLPITDDGCFLAYKKVSGDLKSIHASPDGTYLDHSIGTIVAMPREDVDPNRYRTCSYGLHFCSLDYLKHYGSWNRGDDRVVIVKVNPRDVCAIPNDYSNTKGRASCYEVVAEYDHVDNHDKDAFEESYVDTTQGEDGVRSAMTHVREQVCYRDCDCDEICDDCDEICDDCDCKASNDDVSDGYGTKPSGQRYYNVRENNGRFSKRA